MPTSFISEHSAEFVLVPQFAEILSEITPSVTPIYFWATREGGLISRQCNPGEKLLLVAMFPRRPKIDKPGQSYVHVKFNDTLFKYAEDLESFGIPVFTGVTSISSLKDFNLEAKSAWFYLPSRFHKHGVWNECKLDIANFDTSNNIFVERPLKPKDIIKIIGKVCKPLTWQEAIPILRDVKRNNNPGYYPYGSSGYKPVYFLLWI